MLAAWRAPACLPSHSHCLNLIKPERINSLKKKYDAYLEEDKKRKERNVYILERMDKLRYCTAMVPVRHKPDVIEDQKTALYVSKQTLESPSGLPTVNPKCFPVELPEKILDESTLLQEISKKYILIPKSRPKYGNDFIHDIIKPETDENTDWKSKYDILKQLKRQEKEDTECSPPQTSHSFTPQLTGKHIINSNIAEKELNPNHEIQLDYKQNYSPQQSKQAKQNIISSLEPHSNNYSEDTYLYQEDLPQSTNETFIEKADIQKPDGRVDSAIYKNTPNEIDENTKSQKEDLENYEHYYPVSHDNLDYNQPDIDANIVEQNVTEIYPVANDDINITQNKSEAVDNTFDQYANEDINDSPLNNDSGNNLNLEHENPVHVITPNESIEQINNDTAIENNNEEVEHLEYPIDIINAQEFTPRDDVNVADEININPVHNVLNSEDMPNYNIDPVAVLSGGNETSGNLFDPIVVTEDANVAETAGIETYDTENNDGYYNETTDNYAYNQEGVVENYNADYSAPTENYSQEEYATYYEGAQAEQPYAAETNGEPLQRYDQNYDQQYGGEYDQQAYQQQEYVQQNSERNDEQNAYTGQEETLDQTPQEDIHYENQNITPQYVEQQLDNEEGYIVEKHNETAEISNQEKTMDNKLPMPQTKAEHK